MNFFERQQQAIQKTRFLVFLYAVCILLLITLIYFGALWILNAMKLPSEVSFPEAFIRMVSGTGALPLWYPRLLLPVSAGVLAVIVIATVFKFFTLRAGGEAIALMLGGELVFPETKDLKERQLINVVEEMAIAAGMVVPDVYILRNEPSINAFAAGFTIPTAVIGVSAGAVKNLSRDELQGVIAHEFSHILSGDMALNLKLVGILHGIIFIALTGYWLVRLTFETSSRGRSRRSKDGNPLAIVGLIGLVLAVSGYIGVFFAKLIKQAISREREYLADARAVQYTRNPLGLSYALQKVFVLSEGAQIRHSQAEQASHMFFANALRGSWLNLFSTHPPILKRIKSIDRNFDGQIVKDDLFRNSDTILDDTSDVPGESVTSFEEPSKSTSNPSLATVLDSFGTIGGDNLSFANRLLAQLPLVLTTASHDPGKAQFIVYALLMDPDSEKRSAQFEILQNELTADQYTLFQQLLTKTDSLKVTSRLPLLDLAIPSLRRMSKDEYVSFKEVTQKLIECDGVVNVFEFTLRTVLSHQLERKYFSEKSLQKDLPLEELLVPVSKLLWQIALFGNEHSPEAPYENAADLLGIKKSVQEKTKSSTTSASILELEKTLLVTSRSPFPVKKEILKAVMRCIEHDGVIEAREGELLRALGETYGCPLPPFESANRAAG